MVHNESFADKYNMPPKHYEKEFNAAVELINRESVSGAPTNKDIYKVLSTQFNMPISEVAVMDSHYDSEMAKAQNPIIVVI